MIKYIGSKRALVPVIERVARRLPIRSAADLFAGTTRAGQAFRRAGCRVVSNDLATYCEALGQAYIAADERPRPRRGCGRCSRGLDALPGTPGYVTRTFCEQARFFSARERRPHRRDPRRDRPARRPRSAARRAC